MKANESACWKCVCINVAIYQGANYGGARGSLAPLIKTWAPLKSWLWNFWKVSKILIIYHFAVHLDISLPSSSWFMHTIRLLLMYDLYMGDSSLIHLNKGICVHAVLAIASRAWRCNITTSLILTQRQERHQTCVCQRLSVFLWGTCKQHPS